MCSRAVSAVRHKSNRTAHKPTYATRSESRLSRRLPPSAVCTPPYTVPTRPGEANAAYSEYLVCLSRLWKAEERTRTAFLLITSDTSRVAGLARACKSRISRRIPLLWVAGRCTVLLSRWCQGSVNIIRHPSEQEGVACRQLVELGLLLCIAYASEAPARVLHHTVSPHELSGDHSSHKHFLCLLGTRYPTRVEGDGLEPHRQLRSPAEERPRTGDAQIDDAPDLTMLPSANDARFSEAIHDTREPLHRWAWRRQPPALRLRFFQAAKSRLRRRTNAANTSPVNRAK
jgi:hypothetical protein